MKIYHTAAPALAAWYLMIPPTVPGTHEVNKSVPLSQWTIRRTFPHDQGCEGAKFNLRKQALAHNAQLDSTGRRRPADPDLFCVLCNAQCVEDNDPRLKAN
jgi:hypothetical protein